MSDSPSLDADTLHEELAATLVQARVTVGHEDLRSVGDLDITHRIRRSSFASTTQPECHQPPGRVQLALAHARRIVKARQVVRIRGNGAPDSARIVAILVVKDEAPRLPFLLEYYRRAGVEHFFVIDNGSSDGLDDMLRTSPDVTYFHADGAYGSSRYGNDWINHVASKYCTGRWVLYIDADEFLVTSHTPLDLHTLCDGLERRPARHAHGHDRHV